MPVGTSAKRSQIDEIAMSSTTAAATTMMMMMIII